MEMVEIPKANIDGKVESERSEIEEETPSLEDDDTIATGTAEYLIIDEQDCSALATKGEFCKDNL